MNRKIILTISVDLILNINEGVNITNQVNSLIEELQFSDPSDGLVIDSKVTNLEIKDSK